MTAETRPQVHVVTGAFGFSGQYIARRLLAAGHAVRTLTNSPRKPDPFDGRVQLFPLDFGTPGKLTEALRGVEVLYNTYWVRFNASAFSHAGAVENTLKLFAAAREAGVRRLVHVSITNPAEDSPLEYFRGKARLERALKESGLSCAILRPAVLFGPEDVLINNIAWGLRRFPVVPVFGDGRYRLQPIFVDDLAALAVAQGAATGNVTVEAIGPETFTYRELVARIGEIIGKRRPVLPLPPWLGFLMFRSLGFLLRDRVLTRAEIEGLMAERLYVNAPPAGTTKLTEWAAANADRLGRRYANELARRRDRVTPYSKL